MYKYLEKENEISFDKIFNQILGKFHVHTQSVKRIKCDPIVYMKFPFVGIAPYIFQVICYSKTFAKMHQKNRFHI